MGEEAELWGQKTGLLEPRWLSWILFPESRAAQRTGPVSPETLGISDFLVTLDKSRWKQGRRSPWPNPVSSVNERELHFLVVFKVEWRPLLLHFVFLTQNFWNREFKNTSSNKNTENILFIKHTHMVYCDGLVSSLFHGQCCISVHKETPNNLHTSTPELRFLLHKWPRFKYVTLLIGSFLVALYLVGIFFFL